jgi:DNA primase small subunit
LRNDEAKDLGSDERKEIVDYVMGLGFDPNSYSGLLDERFTIAEYSPEQRGWPGRIRRGAYEILTETSESELANWGINRRIAKTMASRRDELASAWIGEAKSRRLEGVGPTTWKTIIQKAVERESAKVDTVVTTDIHRLIRLPETLNAKTGLKAMEANNIESFDPFKDAIAFEGEETVYATDAPQFRIGNQTFGPYTSQTVTVPSAAAILLIAKGKAVPRRE